MRKKEIVLLCLILGGIALCFFVIGGAFICVNLFGKNASPSSLVTSSDYYFEDLPSNVISSDIEASTDAGYDYYDYENNINTGSGNLTYYTEAGDFSEGLAWVRISEFSNTGEWIKSKRACINTSNQIVYSTLESSNWSDHIADFEPTQFVQGVSIVDENTLINNKGEIVWSVENNGWNYANKKFGENATKSIKLYDGGYFLGYTFVNFYVDSFEETATYCGVLNPDGSWRTDPFVVKDEVNFADNGMYSFRTKDETGYYNSSCQYDPESNKFINDIDLTDTATANTLTSKKDQYNFGLHDNMMYNSEKQGFVDVSGNTVIDLSRYSGIDAKKDSTTGYYSYPTFNNGYCVLSVRNQQRSKYMTVINTKGEELFEPIKCEDYEHIVSDGLLLAEIEDGDDVFLNMNGEIAIDPAGKASSFSEGYAVVYEKDSITDMYIYSYIDTNGNTVLK